ncbi:MAG: GIY-YIG nuclease family protein [Candidatus Odinarchaeota archaeon]
MGKTYANTPKSRREIPSKPGSYALKTQSGKSLYYGETNNLNRRIKEHHYDKSKHFSKVSITPTKTKSQAKKIEDRRLHQKKPPLNKKK